MAINKATMVDTLDANLNEIWLDGLNRWPEEYSKIFRVENSTKASEKDSYLSGFGTFPVKAEGTAAQYDTLYQGPAKTYVNKTYALGYEVTEEAIEDNQHSADTFNKFPQALNDSAIETVELTAATVINNGIAGSDTGPDGVSFLNTAHPLLGGGTQANTPAVQADLSVTSLQAALQAIEDMTDERGKKAMCLASLLVVPTGNMWVAHELLKSPRKPLKGIGAFTLCLN